MEMMGMDWREELRSGRHAGPLLAPLVGEALAELEVGAIEVLSEGELSMTTDAGGELRVRLDNLRASLAQADGPEARVGIVEHFARAIAEALEKSGHEDALRREDLVPLVRDKTYIEQLGDLEAETGVVVFPFVADLFMVLAFDGSHTQHLATRAALARLDISRDDALALAKTNLDERLDEIEQRSLEESEAQCSVAMLVTGGDLEASLLLLDDLWARIKLNARGDIVACAPARDVVLFADTADEGALVRMGEIADEVIANGDHVISPTLLRRTLDGWERYADA
jgi:uncharacterized protein YtpQ (UPF0354 family)